MISLPVPVTAVVLFLALAAVVPGLVPAFVRRRIWASSRRGHAVNLAGVVALCVVALSDIPDGVELSIPFGLVAFWGGLAGDETRPARRVFEFRGRVVFGVTSAALLLTGRPEQQWIMLGMVIFLAVITITSAINDARIPHADLRCR